MISHYNVCFTAPGAAGRGEAGAVYDVGSWAGGGSPGICADGAHTPSTATTLR